MKNYNFFPLLFVFLNIVFIHHIIAQENKPAMVEPSVVDSVDLTKYIGTWYEIAKIPNSFQDHCTGNTTATYHIREDGRLDVINRCMDEDGEMDEATGIARVVDPKSNAKLEVSFVRIFGISLFWGDYWIIGLEKNYHFALVGNPSRKYGWILCRDKQMSAEDLEQAYTILRKQGYNPEDFETTDQSL
jgi:apolipoprotein D and lipocalin family protein